MEQEATYLMTAGRIWDNEIEINFGDETYHTIPITLRENVPENPSEELSVKRDSDQCEFEMEWIIQ